MAKITFVLIVEVGSLNDSLTWDKAARWYNSIGLSESGLKILKAKDMRDFTVSNSVIFPLKYVQEYM